MLSHGFPALLSILTLSLAVTVSSKADDSIYKGKPHGGKPAPIPGKIEAEHYDVAPGNANGIAYQRNGTPKDGPERTTGDCIGLGRIDDSHVSTAGVKETPGGIYVGWTDVGDWWNYTIQVPKDGAYKLGAKMSAGAKDAKISVKFAPLGGGEAVATGPIVIPTTAGFQPAVEVYHVWETLDNMATVHLKKGVYVMTVKVEEKAGMNMDFYTLTAAD